MNSTAAAAVSPPAAELSARSSFNALLWSVQRELWENRSVYVAPLAAAMIFLVGFVVRLIVMPESVRGPFAAAAAATRESVVEPYTLAALVMMATGVVVGIFYCLDTLYAERRDRSILFWKSLPVSDRTTVLAKLCIPFVVLPLLTTVGSFAMHFVMLTLSSVVLWTGGLGAGALWQDVAPLHLGLKVFYHMVSMHVLWYAPIFAWLLLASAVARRAPFLWAGIPVLAIAVVEYLALGSSRFVDAIKFRFIGDPANMNGSNDPLAHGSLSELFSSPDLWAGLVLAAVFVAATIQIRRRNEPL